MNSSHGSSVASAGVPTNQPIMQQNFHNPRMATTATTYSVHTGNAAILPPTHYSELEYSHSSASLPPVQTPSSNNNNPNADEFYLKDALRGFFAEGQRQDLNPFCNKNAARRMTMSREIKKHQVLQQVWNRRVKGMGFTKEDSKVALNFIDKLDLPNRPPHEPSVIPSTAQQSLSRDMDPSKNVDDIITTAKSTVNVLVNHYLSIEGHQIVGCKDDLLIDENFVTTMQMLRAANVYCVPCDNGSTAISCQSPSCNVSQDAVPTSLYFLDKYPAVSRSCCAIGMRAVCACILL